MIYLLSIPLESEPRIHAKDDKGQQHLGYKVSSWWLQLGMCRCSGESWVICMPQILTHCIWQAKQTEIAAAIKHGLVPMGCHSHKLTGHYKFKKQNQYFKSFKKIIFRKDKLIEAILETKVSSMYRTFICWRKLSLL